LRGAQATKQSSFLAFWIASLSLAMTAIDFRGLANADASLSNQESLNRPPHLWRFGALKVLE
jgi:hypothetical protein